MDPFHENDLVDACRLLFGTHIGVNREFLQYMQVDGLRRAYRSRAREYHPDVAAGNADQMRRTELFRRSVEAYELLSGYLQQRQVTVARPRPTVHRAARPAPPPAPARKADERFYRGPFPSVELKIGLFLYYSGRISYQALVRSLLWQREQRPPLGELACKWGWMQKEAIPGVLKATSIPGYFGERAIKLGLLTEPQLRVLLFHQRSLHQPIGRYFVGQGLLTEDLLRRSLRECNQHNEKVRTARQPSTNPKDCYNRTRV